MATLSAARTGLGGVRARLERMPVLGPILEVQKRYSELRGNNLAAAVTFQAFISLFPLMLVIVAVVGFVAAGTDVNVAGRIVDSLGLSGESARTITNAVTEAEKNRVATAPLAIAALLWSGLGLVNAFQFAFNQVWQVDERGMKDKAVGLLWLLGAALLFVATAAVTTVLNWLPGVMAPLGILVGLTVNFGLWLWTFKVLPNRSLPWRGARAGRGARRDRHGVAQDRRRGVGAARGCQLVGALRLARRRVRRAGVAAVLRPAGRVRLRAERRAVGETRRDQEGLDRGPRRAGRQTARRRVARRASAA